MNSIIRHLILATLHAVKSEVITHSPVCDYDIININGAPLIHRVFLARHVLKALRAMGWKDNALVVICKELDALAHEGIIRVHIGEQGMQKIRYYWI